MTFEQLEALRALKVEEDATRERLISGNLAPAHREVEKERLLELVGKRLELEAAAEPQPTPNAEVAKLTPAEAAKRAAEIRARPEFFNSGHMGKDGTPVLSREKHAALVAEHVELMERSLQPEKAGSTP